MGLGARLETLAIGTRQVRRQGAGSSLRAPSAREDGVRAAFSCRPRGPSSGDHRLSATFCGRK